MQKLALDVDPAVVARYAAGGALVGGGAAAMVNLVHMINQMKAERARRMKPTETDENTIVLTLPKRAEAVTTDENTIPKKVIGPTSKMYLINRDKSQSREDLTQKFGPKLCMNKKMAGASGWPTLTAAVLAALGGGAAGVGLVNKLYEVQREKRLKEELEAAKQEYMSALTAKSVKGASVLDNLFPSSPDNEKQADSTFGMLNYPMAALAILTILGAGSTGYLTKKILDEKLRATSEAGLEIPKIKRIVFRTEPQPPVTEQDKQAELEDVESVASGLLVMMDNVGGENRFTSAPEIKEAMAKAGLTATQLVKQADDWDTLMTQLGNAPELRHSMYKLYNKYTASNPISRGLGHVALSTGMGQRAADKKLYTKLTDMRANLKPGQMHDKVAQETMSPAGIIGTSILGRTVGRDLMNGQTASPDEMAKLIVEAQDEAKRKTLLQDTKEPGTVQVVAHGKAAKRYLTKNQEKIKAVVKRLAAEGQI